MTKELVFVYGSLKAGYPLHYILEDEDFVGEYRTKPDYKLINLGPFPALVPVIKGEGVEVRGEVYRVDNDILNYLDVVEGVNRGMYRRSLLDVHDQLGRQITVHAYIADRAGEYSRIEIESGVW